MGRGPSTNAQRADAARRKTAQAVELRIAGHTYAQISAALGYAGPGSAYKAVQRGLNVEEQEQSADRKVLRSRQHLRIQRLLAATWGTAMKGDTKAIAAARQLLEREARLLGLDEPTNVRITDALDPEIEAILRTLGVPVDGDEPEPGPE